MLAIRPKTGEIACYYQYTPNDVYDVDATDEQVLADIQVAGQLRKVMMQTNKNGFLYVVDRTNCKLIAVSWVCSRTILGSKMNTESVQTAKIIIRKQ